MHTFKKWKNILYIYIYLYIYIKILKPSIGSYIYIYLEIYQFFSIRSGLTRAVCHLSGPGQLFGCIIHIYIYIDILQTIGTYICHIYRYIDIYLDIYSR